ncbi:MAG: phosphatase PAP2 family protein [Alphaproteobacteria bacterium]|nr:phosphatase PAP2 family protein [Alphaproteobacteria bacterium]
MLDEPIRDGMQDIRNDFTNDLSDAFEPFGRGYVVIGASGAGYLIGVVTGNERLAKTSVTAFQTFAIAAGITQGTKFLVGRERPNADFGSTVFRGPGLDGPRSLPSGHVTHAFALATVIASEYNETPVVPVLAYGIASLTAFSRMNDDKHWMTDVILGAGIGYTIGKISHRLSPFLVDGTMTVEPIVSSEMTVVRVGLRL